MTARPNSSPQAAPTGLADDRTVAERILRHIDQRTTDLGAGSWREPVANYCSEARLDAERKLIRRLSTPLCPSAALTEPGSFLTRTVAGTPLLSVRGEDNIVRVFRNACRHRGAQVADGGGCARAFVCPYHGWTYGLDGALRAVPHEHGFPDLDRATHGLVPVASLEVSGVVFAAQDAPLDPPPADFPLLVPPDYRLLTITELETPANWKVVAEGFLEGYHIRATHENTFYPVQFDNLNVIEHFGRNSRVTFPYRAVGKLRGQPPDEWKVEGKLTYVYHLFPNVMFATFPGRMVMVVLDPIDLAHTRQTTYTLTNRPDDNVGRTEVREGLDFVSAGAEEDREVVASVQRGIASGANTHFEFGLFEGAIRHFHKNLHALIDA